MLSQLTVYSWSGREPELPYSTQKLLVFERVTIWNEKSVSLLQSFSRMYVENI